MPRTSAERVKDYNERKKAEGAKRGWIPASVLELAAKAGGLEKLPEFLRAANEGHLEAYKAERVADHARLEGLRREEKLQSELRKQKEEFAKLRFYLPESLRYRADRVGGLEKIDSAMTAAEDRYIKAEDELARLRKHWAVRLFCRGISRP